MKPRISTREPFTMMPTEILRAENLSNHAKLLYAHLRSFNPSRPPQALLRDLLGNGKKKAGKSTIANAIKELVSLGLISVQSGKGLNRASRYSFNQIDSGTLVSKLESYRRTTAPLDEDKNKNNNKTNNNNAYEIHVHDQDKHIQSPLLNAKPESICTNHCENLEPEISTRISTEDVLQTVQSFLVHCLDDQRAFFDCFDGAFAGESIDVEETANALSKDKNIQRLFSGIEDLKNFIKNEIQEIMERHDFLED
jgi:hypothetical protein